MEEQVLGGLVTGKASHENNRDNVLMLETPVVIMVLQAYHGGTVLALLLVKQFTLPSQRHG
jgi:hypothetical protein